MDRLNFYKYLQVDQEAEQDMIETAYRNLSRKYHPDLNGEKRAHDLMCLINEAYEILGNPEKRKLYDLSLKRGRNGIQENKGKGSTLSSKEMVIVQQSYELIDAYLYGIKTGLFHESYKCIHPMHKDVLPLKVFRNWQRLVSTVYSMNHYEIGFESIDCNVLVDDKRFSYLVTFKVKVDEFNHIMEKKEQDFFYKHILIDEGISGVYLDQDDVMEIMKRFERLAKLRNGKRYWLQKIRNEGLANNSSDLYHVLDQEVERYRRYAVPFSLAIVMALSTNEALQSEVSDKLKSVLVNNSRKLDRIISRQRNLYVVVLPGTQLDEASRYTDKICGIIETLRFKVNDKFSLRRIAIENQNQKTEDLIHLINDEIETLKK